MTQAGEPQREAAASGADEQPETVLKLKADAVDWREVEGQVVALDRGGSVYLAINGTGTVLWPAIVQGSTRTALLQILLETFDVEPARASADVDAFIADLSERSLLERSG